MAKKDLVARAAPMVVAGFTGLAAALAPIKADAQAILKIGPVDEYNNFVTNLVINQPSRFGVQLDLRGDPTKKINSVDWDVFFGSLTNYVSLNGAQLPNHNTSEDFFMGFGMDSSYNRVDSTLNATSYADDNVRMAISGTGPSNRIGFVGFYDVTPTALATNVRMRVANYHLYDTTSASVPITRSEVYLNIVNIPEPSAVGLAALGLGAFALRRKLHSRNHQHARNTGRKFR
jgi:hypothetical protein